MDVIMPQHIFVTAGAIIFVYKLLIMNDFNGLREGLHGGSELLQLNGLVTVNALQMRHKMLNLGLQNCCLLCTFL